MTLDQYGIWDDARSEADKLQAAAELFVRKHGAITADDLYELAPNFRGNKKAFGGILVAMRKAGIIKASGYVKGRCNARPIVRWVLDVDAERRAGGMVMGVGAQ